MCGLGRDSVHIYLYIRNSSETIHFEPEIGKVGASHDVLDISVYISFCNTQSKVWRYLQSHKSNMYLRILALTP